MELQYACKVLSTYSGGAPHVLSAPRCGHAPPRTVPARITSSELPYVHAGTRRLKLGHAVINAFIIRWLSMTKSGARVMLEFKTAAGKQLLPQY